MAQTDSIFEAIKQHTAITAENTSFGPIDEQLYWFALISCVVAIIAFVVSAIALYYNFLTLRSQQKTEQNTQPLLTRNAQMLLLGELYYTLLENYVRIAAMRIWIIEGSHTEQRHLIRLFLAKMVLPANYVHLELFYEHQEEFMEMSELLTDIQTNNAVIMSLTADDLAEESAANRLSWISERIIGDTANEVYRCLSHIYQEEGKSLAKTKQRVYVKHSLKPHADQDDLLEEEWTDFRWGLGNYFAMHDETLFRELKNQMQGIKP